MQAIQKLYFPALAEYSLEGTESSLKQAVEIGHALCGMNPEHIISIHEQCMQLLVVNVDADIALQLYKRSFVFLIEIMLACNSQPQPVKRMEKVFSEMQEQLNRSNESFEMVKNKYENVLQHMDSGIAIFDSEGTLSFINVQMAKLLDVSRNELVGCSLKKILTHRKLSISTRRTIMRLYKEIALKRSRYYEFQHRDDSHLLVTVTYGDQLDGDILISIKDVSEYKQIEQTAMQNDKLAMLGKIAAAIAHEVRNPLTSIRGFIQLLRPYLLEVGKAEYARIILTEIDRANDIIYEFLNSSKPTAPMKQLVPIDSLIKEVIMLMESEALMRNCEIIADNVGQNDMVSIDVKQVKQVILNMIKNALDALEGMHKERRSLIDIRTTCENDYVKITITDNGKGMDNETKARLFDPFFTTKESGTGLGLSVSYRIIRNHGGMIRVDSQAGLGTSFHVYLPLSV